MLPLLYKLLLNAVTAIIFGYFRSKYEEHEAEHKEKDIPKNIDIADPNNRNTFYKLLKLKRYLEEQNNKSNKN